MTEQPQAHLLGDWHLLIQQPKDQIAKRVIFLIHGWTGDERSMWVFASRLPEDALLIAPRAPFPSVHENYAGYSWVKERSAELSTFEDFAEGRARFTQLLALLSKEREENFSHFSMIGFSQGAALSYSFALQSPAKIEKLAALAGFLPKGSEGLAKEQPLQGKEVFIAHGSRDETVPVESAHEARDTMTLAGADLRYCEADIGHKLAAECFRGLEEFFA
jgi:phospholipase/carboxylesterase